MGAALFSVTTPDELDPVLVHAIEEALLFGKLDDLDEVLDRIADAEVAGELRYGLESLRHFRAHYTAEAPKLSDASRQQVTRFDAEWTMQLIQMLHHRHFGATEQKQAE